jgi:hypothetical protein
MVDGLLLLGGCAIAFAAFDDITTDTSVTTFMPEYACLAAVAVAFAFVGLRLIRKCRTLTGWLSLVLLVAGIWAQRAIGPGTRLHLGAEYLTILAVEAWFLVLSFRLFAARHALTARSQR